MDVVSCVTTIKCNNSIFVDCRAAVSRRIEYILMEVVELIAQFFAGEEDAALDSAERHTEFISDFVVFIPGYIHIERHAVFIRKLLYGLRDLLDRVGSFGSVKT